MWKFAGYFSTLNQVLNIQHGRFILNSKIKKLCFTTMQSHITINLVLEKYFCLRKINFLKKLNCRIKVLIAWSYLFELAESLLRKGDKFSQMSAPTKSSTKSNDQYVTMCKTNWHRELAQVLLFKALIKCWCNFKVKNWQLLEVKIMWQICY